eukprot:Amastigsp_a519814_8.p2 type:complete len:301 gc:universal Amastigsp_a519814_8:130-1032(+)
MRVDQGLKRSHCAHPDGLRGVGLVVHCDGVSHVDSDWHGDRDRDEEPACDEPEHNADSEEQRADKRGARQSPAETPELQLVEQPEEQVELHLLSVLREHGDDRDAGAHCDVCKPRPLGGPLDAIRRLKAAESLLHAAGDHRNPHARLEQRLGGALVAWHRAQEAEHRQRVDQHPMHERSRHLSRLVLHGKDRRKDVVVVGCVHCHKEDPRILRDLFQADDSPAPKPSRERKRQRFPKAKEQRLRELIVGEECQPFRSHGSVHATPGNRTSSRPRHESEHAQLEHEKQRRAHKKLGPRAPM